MSSHSYHSSRPDRWTMPRGIQDTSLRRKVHGRIQPMEAPTFWERLLGKR